MANLVQLFYRNSFPFVQAPGNTPESSRFNYLKIRDICNKERFRDVVCHGYQFEHQPPSLPICIMNCDIRKAVASE